MDNQNELSAQDKLKLDPSSITTTMMINPEAIGEMSPTIPENFPKENLPKDLCEPQLQKLISCLLQKQFNNVICENSQHLFYECKKWRDNLIFQRIKSWETDYYSSMSELEKKVYINSLKIKKIEYLKKYESIEVISINKGKRNRISSDIEQLSWRINNLNNIKYNFTL